MTTIPLNELWHRAGRAARDDRKRLLALYGVAITAPALVLAAMLYRLVSGKGIAASALRRPIAYVIEPLRDAWMHDEVLSALLFLLCVGLALAAVWGWIGGAITRMAAVHVATGRRESYSDALAFSRRHFRGFAGARAALWAGLLLPLAAAILVAMADRLPGFLGSLLLPPAIVVAAVFVLAAVVAGSVAAVAGFLTSPTIACEDSDAFDAVSRVFGYAAAGLPRLLWVRLLFFGGVLLGAGWRLARLVATLLLLSLVVQAGLGTERFDRCLGVLGGLSRGTGPSAGMGDIVAAATLALVAGVLVASWLSDLVSRTLCARVGAYLALRQEVDRIPADRLRTAPAAPARVDAEAAGFVEVARVGSDAPRPR